MGYISVKISKLNPGIGKLSVDVQKLMEPLHLVFTASFLFGFERANVTQV